MGSPAYGRLVQTYDAATFEQFQALPDDFAPPILKEPYGRVAPDKSRWPMLVAKIKSLGMDFPGYSEAEVRSIKAPTLIMQGDHDAVKAEHAVEMMRMIPNSQLAIFPGQDHFVLYTKPDLVVGTFMAFFDEGGGR